MGQQNTSSSSQPMKQSNVIMVSILRNPWVACQRSLSSTRGRGEELTLIYPIGLEKVSKKIVPRSERVSGERTLEWLGFISVASD